MKYALFIGCQIPSRVTQYETAARAVLKRVGVELVDERQFNCCGYPMRNIGEKAFLLSAVRNLALAEQAGLPMLVLCKCCFGSLKKAEKIMRDEGDLQNEIRRLLSRENLKYDGSRGITHLLSLLYHDIGINGLKEKMTGTFSKDLRIATHHGCHALRPSSVTEFDDPVAPRMFDELVQMTGATGVDWDKKLECCGAPLMGVNDDLSMTLMRKKLKSAKNEKAEYICSACPYCQMQFDTVQKGLVSENGGGAGIGSILYPQLLGICMGMGDKELAINMNQIDISGIRSYLNEE